MPHDSKLPPNILHIIQDLQRLSRPEWGDVSQPHTVLPAVPRTAQHATDRATVSSNMTKVIFGTLVNEAVQESVRREIPLVVALSKEDEDSRSFIDEYMVKNDRLESLASKFVALKLVDKTPEATQFASIFQKLIFPSLYIISKGNLREVITKDVNKDEYLNRLSKLCEVSDEHIKPRENATVQNMTNNPVSSSTTTFRPATKIFSTKSQAEETARIKALIEADKRERKSAKSLKSFCMNDHNPRASLASPVPTNMCALSIKLLDGTTVRHEFKAKQTLNDVRQWLDDESGYTILPDTSTFPAFAATSEHPTSYSFYTPTIPRITYSVTDEFVTLSDLKLCPRSALILKPLYINRHGSYANGDSGSVLRGTAAALKRLGNAVFSFFDYGVDEALDAVHDEDIVSTSGHGSDDESVDPHPTLHSLHRRDHRDGSDEDNEVNLNSERMSRSLTPKLGLAPSMSRIQTVQGAAQGTTSGFSHEDERPQDI